MTERLNWIDVSRGLAFMPVIYCHLPMHSSRLMDFFNPVFLATFFFISGYLFKSGQPFMKVLEQRTRTLLLPLLLLGVIMIATGQVLSFNDHKPMGDELRGLLLQTGDSQILWFIAALFVYSLVFYWIDRWCATPLRLLVLSLILYIVNSMLVNRMGLPNLAWHTEGIGCSCMFMAFGKLYRIYESRIDRMLTWPVIIAGVCAYIGYIWITSAHINHLGSYATVDALIVSTIGLAIVVTVSKRVFHGSRLLIFVGANSLLYFAFHGKAYSLILAGLRAVNPSLAGPSGSVALDLTVAAAVVLLDALILIYPVKLVNRHAPFLTGRNFRLWPTK